jgi:hypothetical protein
VRTLLLQPEQETRAYEHRDAQMRLLLRTFLLRTVAAEQCTQALAYRGWATSVVKQARRTRATATTLVADVHEERRTR